MKKLITGKKKKEASKRGKRSKNKGATYERKIAVIFKENLNINLTRTPQSGGFAKKSNKAEEFKGDLTCLEEDKEFLLHVECKSHKTIALQSWIRQAESDCPKGKITTVVFHEPNTSKEYITLKWGDFLNLIEGSPYPKRKQSKVIDDLLPKEEWKTLNKPYNDYQVSNLGGVRTLKQKQPRMLKQGLGDTGYYNVALCYNGIPKTFRVHRLVAKYFIPNADKKAKVVNHKDGNKLNNVFTNLEWVSSKENNKHAYDTNLRGRGEKHNKHKYSDKDILDIRMKQNMYNMSDDELEKTTKVSLPTIKRVRDVNYRNDYNLNIICKNLKSWKILDWINENKIEGVTNLVIVPFLNTEYATLHLEDFLELCGDKLVKELNKDEH